MAIFEPRTMPVKSQAATPWIVDSTELEIKLQTKLGGPPLDSEMWDTSDQVR